MEIELYEALVSASVAPEKARSVVDAFRRETENKLATKGDLSITEAKLKAELSALRTEMHQMFKDQTRWLGGFIFGAVGIGVAVFKLFP